MVMLPAERFNCSSHMNGAWARQLFPLDSPRGCLARVESKYQYVSKSTFYPYIGSLQEDRFAVLLTLLNHIL